jgi:hypothetical protein
MISLEEIAAVEEQYRGRDGKPSLGDAYSLLLSRWNEGARDRETSLRLMFLAWYALAEPTQLTGLSGSDDTRKVLLQTFESLGGKDSIDPEFCFVAGYMASFLGWIFGNEAQWSAVGHSMLARARRLKPGGLPPEHFEGRGAYGEYFAHVSKHGPFAS